MPTTMTSPSTPHWADDACVKMILAAAEAKEKAMEG